MNKLLLRCLNIALICSTLFIFSGIAQAATPTVTPLVTDPNYHSVPDIYGNRVSYVDSINGVSQSYVYNLKTHKTLQLPNGATSPRIYSNYVVYADTDGQGVSQIYLYNLNTNATEQISNNSNTHQEPDIWGNYVVWAEYAPNSNYNIYLYNISSNTTTQITNSNSVDQYNPSVKNTWVTWTSGSTTSAAIDAYNLTTAQTRLVASEPFADHSRSQGNTVVWADQRLGTNNSDIYMMNLKTNKGLLVSNGTDFCGTPAIYDSNIVYVDFSSNSGDIEEYNTQTKQTTPITSDPATQSQPAIQGNNIVWVDYRNGPPEIYGLL